MAATSGGGTVVRPLRVVPRNSAGTGQPGPADGGCGPWRRGQEATAPASGSRVEQAQPPPPATPPPALAALQSLPAVQRRALVKRYVLGMWPSQVAADDDVSTEVVTRRLVHAALAFSHHLGCSVTLGGHEQEVARRLAPLRDVPLDVLLPESAAPTSTAEPTKPRGHRRLIRASAAAALLAATGAAASAAVAYDEISAGATSPVGQEATPPPGSDAAPGLPPVATAAPSPGVRPGPDATAALTPPYGAGPAGFALNSAAASLPAPPPGTPAGDPLPPPPAGGGPAASRAPGATQGSSSAPWPSSDSSSPSSSPAPTGSSPGSPDPPSRSSSPRPSSESSQASSSSSAPAGLSSSPGRPAQPAGWSGQSDKSASTRDGRGADRESSAPPDGPSRARDDAPQDGKGQGHPSRG